MNELANAEKLQELGNMLRDYINQRKRLKKIMDNLLELLDKLDKQEIIIEGALNDTIAIIDKRISSIRSIKFSERYRENAVKIIRGKESAQALEELATAKISAKNKYIDLENELTAVNDKIANMEEQIKILSNQIASTEAEEEA